MRWFALGVFLVCSAASAALDIYLFETEYDPRWVDGARFDARLTAYTLTFAVVMGAAVCAGALLLQAARPMRLFAPRGGRRRIKVLLGAVAGLLAGAMATMAIPLADGAVPDTLVAGGCGLIAGVLTPLVSCRRDRPGHCVGCGYDLRGSRLSGKCPECGMSCKPDYAPAGGRASNARSRSNMRAARSSVSS